MGGSEEETLAEGKRGVGKGAGSGINQGMDRRTLYVFPLWVEIHADWTQMDTRNILARTTTRSSLSLADQESRTPCPMRLISCEGLGRCIWATNLGQSVSRLSD